MLLPVLILFTVADDRRRLADHLGSLGRLQRTRRTSSSPSPSMLSRITIPYLMLISLASLLGGILNSLDRFWVNAAAPILLNISMIVALWFFHGARPVPRPRAPRRSRSPSAACCSSAG